MKHCEILYILLLSPISIFATNYYVAPWGNDAWSGTSWDSAFVTLQHAADIVAAGDSVFVASGDYTGFDLRTDGTPSLPIVFQASGDSVVINVDNPVTPDGINIEGADWIVIDGFRLINLTRAGIRVVLSQHVEVKNNFCDANGRWGIFTGFADYAYLHHNICQYSQDEHGIYFSNSADHPIIRYNICHHNHANGIHMNGDEGMGGDGLITDATVECNIIYENGLGGGSGINCDGVAESYFFNNLLYMNHASGISLYRIDASAGSYDNKIFNNTIVNAADARWCLNINTNSYGDTIYNNIFINLHPWRGSISIDASSLTDFWSDYNICINSMSNDGGNSAMTFAQWQALGYDPNSMLADPLDSIFSDWQNGDYHLKENSQAIDNGTDLVSYLVQYDLDGNPRPFGIAYDIGCYEGTETGIIQSQKTNVDDIQYRIYQKSEFIIIDNLNSDDHIAIFDISGRCVRRAENLASGCCRINTTDFPSGIYFYVITSRQSLITGKIIIIK